jgi:hypothetical protein
MPHTNRFNVEETADGFRVCRGDHARSADCEWVQYVPKPTESQIQRNVEFVATAIADAREAQLVPGLWHCAKCGFELMRQSFNANTGQVGVSVANATEPELCPNDANLLERVTWKEHFEGAAKALDRMYSQQWLIWSHEHEAWWGQNENGYTKDRAEAGRYPFARAREICESANRGKKQIEETMLPVTDSGGGT